MDTVLSILKYTAFNPLNTLPLYLAGLYTTHGREYFAKHPHVFKWLKVCLALGLWRRISGFLDTGVSNNWTNDTYDWPKELVVVTGGSDGIGAEIVKLLAEHGIKVAVLDIQEPKYIGMWKYGHYMKFLQARRNHCWKKDLKAYNLYTHSTTKRTLLPLRPCVSRQDKEHC